MNVPQKIDRELLQELLIREPLAQAERKYGTIGINGVKGILRFLRICAQYSKVNEHSDVTVFALLNSDASIDALRQQHASAVRPGVEVRGSISNLVVEVRPDNSSFVWTNLPPSITTASSEGIVYQLRQGFETFSIGGSQVVVQKVMAGAVSQFLVNYFTDLRDALRAYGDNMARTSKCHLLREAWGDQNRLWFTPEPEYRLRRALHNFLCAYLRHDEIDIREEQNVDESHPVDIKIVWRMERRSALIEVKWIGKSIDNLKGTVTANYSDARARQGAKQLAEYLEWHRQQDAREDTRGYLVVFDCRRRGVKPSRPTVSREDGFYFAIREVKYTPAYHAERSDFEEPIRIFLEPICV